MTGHIAYLFFLSNLERLRHFLEKIAVLYTNQKAIAQTKSPHLNLSEDMIVC